MKKEPPAAAEIDALIRSAETRLRDASNGTLAVESRFDLAYNAAHSISLAALRLHGYRSEQRYLVFQTLVHTVELAPEQWRVLDEAHRKRNAVEYMGVSDVSEQLVAAVIRTAQEVLKRVRSLVAKERS